MQKYADVCKIFRYVLDVISKAFLQFVALYLSENIEKNPEE